MASRKGMWFVAVGVLHSPSFSEPAQLSSGLVWLGRRVICTERPGDGQDSGRLWIANSTSVRFVSLQGGTLTGPFLALGLLASCACSGVYQSCGHTRARKGGTTGSPECSDGMDEKNIASGLQGCLGFQVTRQAFLGCGPEGAGRDPFMCGTFSGAGLKSQNV